MRESRSFCAGAFSVNGDEGRLMVEILGYENPKSQTVSDANWLRAKVQLDVKQCTVQAEVALTTQDVKHLLEELKVALLKLAGSANLVTDEGQIKIQIELQKSGLARVSGELYDAGVATVKINFEFTSDQTFLSKTIAELRDIQRRCPVIETV